MKQPKRFPLQVLLTVTTERLLTRPRSASDNGIGDLYELLGWMTDDSPFTHQLRRFGDECKPWLLRWFPELARADLTVLDALREAHGTRAGITLWLDGLPAAIGCKTEYDVPRIPADDHQRKHPWDELIAMRGTDEGVIPIIEGNLE